MIIERFTNHGSRFTGNAWVAELVDARDLKSLPPLAGAGSTPALGTNDFNT